MCQVNDDDLNNLLAPKPDFRNFRKCLKCDSNSVIVVRINDALCKQCFMDYFIHKFRATIGKSKVLDIDENVLFAYSGSGSSVAMLHLIAQGVSQEAKKKFRFKPTLLFIEDNYLFDDQYDINKRIKYLQQIQDSVKYSKFKIYFSSLENSFVEEDNADSSDDSICSDDIEKLKFDETKRIKFLELVNGIKNQTSKEEMIKRMRLQLLNRIANRLEIRKVFLAVTCTKLTIDILNNVAIGKGAHISFETSMEEKKNESLIYLRPLRELTSKEVAFYNHYVGMTDSILSSSKNFMNLPNSTIYRLTEKFINGLQNDYPTTVSTIFRTSDKLVPIDDLELSNFNCVLCKCPLDTNVNIAATSSAINDLKFSNTISKLEPNESSSKNSSSQIETESENFCYSCSIIIKDLNDKSKLPTNLTERRNEMRNQIKDYLIED